MSPKISNKLLKEIGIDSAASKVKEALDENKAVEQELLESIPGTKIQNFLQKKFDQENADLIDYEKEDLLKKVHKLLIVGATTVQIAQTLSITNKKATELKTELRKRLADDLRQLDPREVIAESVAFYDFIKAKAISRAGKLEQSNGRYVEKDLIAAYSLAMQANQAKDKFLIDSGLLDNLQEDNSDLRYVKDANDIQTLINATVENEEVILDLDSYVLLEENDE